MSSMYNIIFQNTIPALNNIICQCIHTDVLHNSTCQNAHTKILQDIICQYMGAGHVQAYLSADAQAAKTTTSCCK